MAKQIKIKVYKNFFNILEVLEIENGKNFRYVLSPDTEKELDPAVEAVAKEVWTDEIKESYRSHIENHIQMMNEEANEEETNE